MTNFTREQIAEAIDKYQDEHRLYAPATYDVTSLKGKESADKITEEINKIVAKVNKDTEMWLICEMAKMYMQGVVPHYEVRNKGEWELTEDEMFVFCPFCHKTEYTRPIDASWHFCPECGAELE